jgi:EmrB/QacA subfamily drug resistance transporter
VWFSNRRHLLPSLSRREERKKKKTMNEPRKNSTRRWVLALASVASFMISLDLQVVATALPTIHRSLGASIEQLEWTVNAYVLSFAVLLMTGTALGDRFGRRRLFVGGLVLFVVASAACALAPTIGWLISARALQGAGAALIFPLALTLVSAAFPPAQRGRALGIFGSISGLALIAGPVVGGAVAQGLAWQWIFWLNVPIGLLVMALVLGNVPESFGGRAALDMGGLLLVTGAALLIVWGLVRSNAAGWDSLEVVATLLAGVVLGVAFVVWELRAHAPMIPMRFFRSRSFSAGNAANFLFMGAVFGTLFFLAQFLQNAQGYGPLAAGLRLLPWTGCLFVIAPIAGSLVDRVGERPLIVSGLLLQAVGLAWIALVARPGLAYAELVVPLLIAGCGAALAWPTTQNVVVSAVAADEIGKASGTFSMLRQLGGAFGVAVLAAVFAGVGGFRTAGAFSHGFTAAMSVAAALSLVGAIAGLLLPSRRDTAVVRTTARPERREQEPRGTPERSPSR